MLDRAVHDRPTAMPPAQLNDLRILRRLARDYLGRRKGALAVAVVCMVVAAAMNGLIAWMLGPVVKQIFLQRNLQMIIGLPLAVIAIVVVRALATFWQETTLTGIAERVVSDVQRDMLASQIRLDIAAFSDVHSGELVSKFLYDATLLRGSITRSIPTLGTQFLTLIAMAGVMIYDDWQLAVISVVLLPPVAWVTGTLGRSLKKSSQRSMEETSSLSRTLSEALAGRRIIKAYNLEAHAVENADVRIQARLRYILRAVRSRAAAVPATDLIGGVAIALTFAFAGYQTLHGQLTIDKFTSFVGAMLLAQQPVRMLSQLWTILAEGSAAANRIFVVIDQHPKIVDTPGTRPLLVAAAAIRFDNVSFGYHADAIALDRVTLDIPAGKKVALVGPSGAGKSTIFNILLRFYDCDFGTVTIDGQDIAHVTLESLRNNIALVTQESILFDESVADNIALGRKGATREEIIEAARNAAADGFIRELPDGYETRVGEGALKLSGGQRQRLAIARAMLRNAPILLLDEATSALDTESERQVQDALARLMTGKTTIVIAHRLSTVLDADRIYVMDRGRVVEAGTHAELLARKGLYARLYQHDFRDEQDEEPMAIGA
ncbi:MAG TPA: ABC transporter ATP-binding protein [Rhizomicrobium sp.]|nr:ABC transporter ATP-binding protein [Rhizomicrobium sp.]